MSHDHKLVTSRSLEYSFSEINNNNKNKHTQPKTLLILLIKHNVYHHISEQTSIVLNKFRDGEGKDYVNVSNFAKAIQILHKKRMVVLAGHPGEGKTTMAYKLALEETDSRRCIILKQHSDWRTVDWTLHLFDTVIIDNIFGEGSLNHTLFSGWKPFLPEIELAAKDNRLRFIITTRHYILEECRESLSSVWAEHRSSELGEADESEVTDGTVILLSSTDLTYNECKDIIEAQAKLHNRTISDQESSDLVTAWTENSRGYFMLSQIMHRNFAFGFPECASMFVRNEDLFHLQTMFFRKPTALFKKYVEDLYRSRDIEMQNKFLALVLIWAKEEKYILKNDLHNLRETPKLIKDVVGKYCGTNLDVSLLETIKASLESHKGGYLEFSRHTGAYRFTHNVIREMVGVVLAKNKIRVALELCPRDFLMTRISVDKRCREEYVVTVEPCDTGALAARCIDMILRNNCNKTTTVMRIFSKHVENRLNRITIYSEIDPGIIHQTAFENLHFVRQFLDLARERNVITQLFLTPVMEMTRYFLDYGICMQEFKMYIASYALLHNLKTFAREVIAQKIIPNENMDHLLLLSTHAGDTDTMKFVLSQGAKVTGDTIYVAIHTTDVNVLATLLSISGIDANDRGNIINGNTPLIVAAEKGNYEAAQCLLEHGANPALTNHDGLSAIHRAVTYQHTEIVKLLLDHDAPLNDKGGTFQRTPLHIACHRGCTAIIKVLLEKGASVTLKDKRRHYPVHLAAIKGHCDVVEMLLRHDKSQDGLRIPWSGTQHKSEQISLYHVAILKQNPELIDVLIEMEADPNVSDSYGQTPFYYSVMVGEEKIMSRLLNMDSVNKNQAREDGTTPLHLAIKKGHTDVSKRVAAKVNVNIQDRNGRTPLHIACEKANIEIVKWLVEQCGADPRICTETDDTVYQILHSKPLGVLSKDFWERRREIIAYFKSFDPDLQNIPKTLTNNDKKDTVDVQEDDIYMEENNIDYDNHCLEDYDYDLDNEGYDRFQEQYDTEHEENDYNSEQYGIDYEEDDVNYDEYDVYHEDFYEDYEEYNVYDEENDDEQYNVELELHLEEAYVDQDEYGCDRDEFAVDIAENAIDHEEYDVDHEEYDIDYEYNDSNHEEYNIDYEDNDYSHEECNIDYENNDSNHEEYNVDFDENDFNHEECNIDYEDNDFNPEECNIDYEDNDSNHEEYNIDYE